ncbi:MAG: cbb3-type cytochrome oxidase assembly protein CcoS [Magnetospiraceae bacterium]
MKSLLYLIPVALTLGFVGLVAFLWALKSGQFDDLDGAANRILFDDEDMRQGSGDDASSNPSPGKGA